jgi:quinol monooxygenase YgiN
MPVTVVGHRRAQPGQEEALIAAAIPLLECRRSGASTPSRVFQSLSDPQAVLYIDTWESRAAFQAQDPQRLAPLDALTEGHPVWRFYRPLSLYECILRAVPAVECTSFRVPPGTEAAVRAFFLERGGPIVQVQPGCLLRVLYQDLDDSGLMFGLTGWDSIAALERAVENFRPEIDPWLLEHDVQIEHFQARTRAEVPFEPPK